MSGKKLEKLALADLKPDPRLERVSMLPTVSSRELERSQAKGAGSKRGLYEARGLEIETEFKALVQSVKTNGVRDPLKVWKSGDQWLIADGRHRWLAAQKAKLNKVECIEVAEADVITIMLDADTRRHFSKGSLAYRAVLLNPQVVTEAEKREKSGKKLPPSAISAEGLAAQVGVGFRVMGTACALYRIFEAHSFLRKKYEASVWTCANTAKLLGDMKFKVKTFERTKKYDLAQPKETAAEKESRILGEDRVAVKERFRTICEFGSEISECWETIENEDLEEIESTFITFIDVMPKRLQNLAVEHLTHTSI